MKPSPGVGHLKTKKERMNESQVPTSFISTALPTLSDKTMTTFDQCTITINYYSFWLNAVFGKLNISF